MERSHVDVSLVMPRSNDTLFLTTNTPFLINLFLYDHYGNTRTV